MTLFQAEEKKDMPPYQEMYYELFHSITKAIILLQEAQMRTEELFVSGHIQAEPKNQFPEKAAFLLPI